MKALNVMTYYDLAVSSRHHRAAGGERQQQQVVRRLVEMGWDCVAWNTTVVGKVGPGCARPVASVQLDIPQRRAALQLRALVDGKLDLAQYQPLPPPPPPPPSSSSSSLGGGVASVLQKLKLRQLNRLSVTLDDLADAQSLTIGNEVVQMFDVIAATPGNAKVFAYLCKTADVDIITLDLGRRIPFQLNKKLIDEAVKRGLSFELNYSGVLGSSSSRKEVLANSRTLLQYLRGRHIIFSSFAENPLQVRGPSDIMNIAAVFGLTKENAHKAVCSNAALVLKHAFCRKLRFLPQEIVSRDDFRARWPELTLPDPAPSITSSSSSKKRGRDEDQDQNREEEEDSEEDDQEEEADVEERDGEKEEQGKEEQGGGHHEGRDDEDGFFAF